MSARHHGGLRTAKVEPRMLRPVEVRHGFVTAPRHHEKNEAEGCREAPVLTRLTIKHDGKARAIAGSFTVLNELLVHLACRKLNENKLFDADIVGDMEPSHS